MHATLLSQSYLTSAYKQMVPASCVITPCPAFFLHAVLKDCPDPHPFRVTYYLDMDSLASSLAHALRFDRPTHPNHYTCVQYTETTSSPLIFRAFALHQHIFPHDDRPLLYWVNCAISGPLCDISLSEIEKELSARNSIAITSRTSGIAARLRHCETSLQYNDPSGFLQEFFEEPSDKHLHDIATLDWRHKSMEFPPNDVEPLTTWLYLRVAQLCAYLRCFPPPDFPPEHISNLTKIIAQLESRIEMSQNKVYEYICHKITVLNQRRLDSTPLSWGSDSD
jgi:hypothetical protein